MGSIFVLCIFTQMLEENEILAGGKIFPKLGKLGEAEVWLPQAQLGALYFSPSPFVFASLSVSAFYINIHICQRHLKGSVFIPPVHATGKVRFGPSGLAP